MHYPAHINAMWLACDRGGQVAVMLAGGKGPLPSGIRASHHFDSMERMLLGLPVIGDAMLTAIERQSVISFELCRRGLFIYHWPDADCVCQIGRRSYGLIYLPGGQLAIGNLPSRARAFIYRAGVAFGSSFCLADDEVHHIHPSDRSSSWI